MLVQVHHPDTGHKLKVLVPSDMFRNAIRTVSLDPESVASTTVARRRILQGYTGELVRRGLVEEVSIDLLDPAGLECRRLSAVSSMADVDLT